MSYIRIVLYVIRIPDIEKTIEENNSVRSLYDRLPVTKGHSLIIPKRHCSNYFNLSVIEQTACWEMVNQLKNILMDKYKPDGFTIRVNVNDAAGQTIPQTSKCKLIATKMENRKIFVTGAGGFIGSHLCERLVMDGAEVTALIR